MFETVVVATDGSTPTERAVAAACDIADRFDSALHAVSVIEEDDPDVRVQAQSALGALAADCDRSLTRVVRAGPTATTIIEYATAVEADLVVMGVRGRDGPYEYNLGSVTEAVVTDSPIPVLTVRHPDY